MRLVYVAGAYRAATLFEVEANIRRARDRAVDVVRAGHYPVVPHLCTGLMDGLASDDHFLAGARELLSRCDEVWLVEGWRRSRGTLLELGVALALGKVVHDEQHHRTDRGGGPHHPLDTDLLREAVCEAWEELAATLEPAPI